MVSGFTDYLDGKIARSFGLESRIGALLDPLADRLYILSTLLALGWRQIIPVWLVVALLGREVFIASLLPVLRRHGYGPLPVHFIGKAATFNLLYAFPLLLLADGDGTAAAIARPIAWGFTWWGTALYWVAGAMYAVQTAQLVRPRARS
jgi:cardiolipin synthase